MIKKNQRRIEEAAPSQPLETPNVFLDTQVYRRFGHDLKQTLLQELRNYAVKDRIHIHTTDITMAEVRRQLHDHVEESAVQVKRAQKLTKKWRRRYPDAVKEIPDLNVDDIARRAFSDFQQDLIGSFKARNHTATNVSAAVVFTDYFERRPPFSALGSKEFPDAFVVHALEGWCDRTGEKMYVIGADKAMAEAVGVSQRLLHLPSLEALLEAVAVLESPDVVERAQRLLAPNRVQAKLVDEIGHQIDRLIPIYSGTDLAEGEATEHEIAGDIEVGTFDVLSSSADEIRVLLRVKIPLTVTVEYEDRTFAMYDKEDDVYIGGESDTVEIDSTPTVRVFVKLQKSHPRVAEVRITTEEFAVEDVYETYK